MKRWCAAVVVLVGLSAGAQEIGTEITPVTPDSSANRPRQEPQDAPAERPAEPSRGGTSRGGRGRDEVKMAETPRDGLASAAAGAFGLRATFGGGDAVPAAGSGGAQAAPVGSVGISYWATDAFALLIDAGFAMAVSPGFAIGFAGSVGMDYHFGTPADALRPLLNVQAGITTGLGADPIASMALTAQAAGGAAYFFSPHFSVTGRLGVGFRLGFGNGSVVFALLTPSIGASWYF